MTDNIHTYLECEKLNNTKQFQIYVSYKLIFKVAKKRKDLIFLINFFNPIFLF